MNNKRNLKDGLVEQLCEFKNKNEPLILLFNKRDARKDKYKQFQINLGCEIAKEIAKSYIDTLIKEIKERDIVEYDFERNDNDTIQRIDSKLIIESVNIDSKIIKDELVPYVDRKTDFKKFSFIAVRYFQIVNEEVKTLTIYSKYFQPATKFKKSFKLCFLDDEIKKLNSDIFYFDGRVDAFEFEKNHYIMNMKLFNSIFDFKEGFNNIIESKRPEIVNQVLIENADAFIEDCKNDGRYNQRLCKIITSDAFERLEGQIHKFPNYFRRFKIPLNLDENNLIQYRGKEDISKILNILMRRYAIDGLTDEEMIITGVEEYIPK